MEQDPTRFALVFNSGDGTQVTVVRPNDQTCPTLFSYSNSYRFLVVGTELNGKVVCWWLEAN